MSSIALFVAYKRYQRAMITAMQNEVLRLLNADEFREQYPTGISTTALLQVVIHILYGASWWDATAASFFWPLAVRRMADAGQLTVSLEKTAANPNKREAVVALSPFGRTIAGKVNAARDRMASPPDAQPLPQQQPQPQHQQQQAAGFVPAGYMPVGGMVQQMPVLVPGGYVPTGHPMEYAAAAAAGPAVQAQQQQAPFAAAVRRIHF